MTRDDICAAMDKYEKRLTMQNNEIGKDFTDIKVKLAHQVQVRDMRGGQVPLKRLRESTVFLHNGEVYLVTTPYSPSMSRGDSYEQLPVCYQFGRNGGTAPLGLNTLVTPVRSELRLLPDEEQTEDTDNAE